MNVGEERREEVVVEAVASPSVVESVSLILARPSGSTREFSGVCKSLISLYTN